MLPGKYLQRCLAAAALWLCCAAVCASADETPPRAADTVNGFFERLQPGMEFVGVAQASLYNNHNYKRVPGFPTRHDRAKLQVLADVFLEARLWKDAIAFVRAEAADGDGLSRQAGGFTGVNDNVKTYDTKLPELWIEQAFLGERLAITLGKLDPFAYFDTNEAANDERAQFLSSQFVNSLAIDSPEYAYGVRIRYVPAAWLAVGAGVFEDGRKFANIFKNRFSIAEIAFMPEPYGLPGTYRFYGWHNSSDHEKLKNTARKNESGSGFGLSFDQYFTDEVCLFARWGTQSSDLYEVRQAWSFGFFVEGNAWARPDDVFGLAYGRGVLSGAYRDQLRAESISPADEGRVEAYYLFRLNDHCAVSPDVQVVHNLTGAGRANTAAEFGLRLHILL